MANGRMLLRVASVVALVAYGSPAHALLSKAQLNCQLAIAKEATKFLKGELHLRQRCIDANLASPGSCSVPAPGALARVGARLDSGLAKHCDFGAATAANLRVIGFPGPCSDADTGDGFTLADLQACMRAGHEDMITGLCGGGTNTGEACTTLADCPDGSPGTFCRGILSVQYDADPAGPFMPSAPKCQDAVVKSTTKFLFTILKSVGKCRSGLLYCRADSEGVVTCKLSGFLPSQCATADSRTAAAIAKSAGQLAEDIRRHCTDDDAAAIGMCEPDQLTVEGGIACLIEAMQDFSDNADPTAPSDLVDYQYATQPVCGDRRVNLPTEECDGTSDAACPTQCGAPAGLFPCLCQNVPRERVVERFGGDRDDVFGHDGATTEGGGYLVDLFDCDGPGGPNTVCNVGPRCSFPPFVPCAPEVGAPPGFDNGDDICAGFSEGICRRTAAGSMGPHCAHDPQQRCDSDGDCGASADCVTTLHGPPRPLASGGIGICVQSVFAEDVVGTLDVASGASSVRVRDRSTVFVGGSVTQPCPVCGGFCSGPGSFIAPGVRSLCANDGDCGGGSTCVLSPVCSYGPNVDQPCRPDAPFGGATDLFGNPSVDCPIGGSVLGAPLDVPTNFRLTGLAKLTPQYACTDPAFAGNACIGGVDEGRLCVADAECTGGTCQPQCFCAGAARPNACGAACVGGAAGGAMCSLDADCPGGFCHPGDCRADLFDTDSIQEGHCTTDGSQCFVNAGIERQGTPGLPSRTTAAVGCIESANGSSPLDTLPAPLALTQPETAIVVGF